MSSPEVWSRVVELDRGPAAWRDDAPPTSLSSVLQSLQLPSIFLSIDAVGIRNVGGEPESRGELL